MPIFSKTFDVKAVPARGKRANDDCPVLTEKLDDFHNISINLGQLSVGFSNGRWVQEQRQSVQITDDDTDIIALRRQLRKAEQTNNLNEIKIEVLMDMLTEQSVKLI